MTKQLREAVQTALTALVQSSEPKKGYRRNELFLQPKAHIEVYQEAIEALEAALAQPQPVLSNDDFDANSKAFLAGYRSGVDVENKRCRDIADEYDHAVAGAIFNAIWARRSS